MRRRRLAFSSFGFGFAVGSILLAFVSETTANPPTLTAFYPPGAERGRSVSTTMSGTFDHWPVKCQVEGDGLTVEPAEEKGVLTIVVAEDARPGVRWIRVHDEEGATSLRPFVIGALPETMEEEPNDDPRQPQWIDEVRTTINGRLAKRGDVDGYAVSLEKGTILAADVQAARPLGSPMDAVLQIVDADGFVQVQNDDAVGLDPRVFFEAPASGTYIVRVFAFPAEPDSSIQFSGSDSYIYRLTLTTSGFIDHAFPLAVSGESTSEIRAVGPNIADGESALIVPTDAGGQTIVLTDPKFAGSAEIRRVSGPTIVEVEPNLPGEAQELADHASVSGRIDPQDDRDAYRLSLKKGEARLFRLESRVFGFPLDAVLTVADMEGKTLAEVDDARRAVDRDSELTFTPEADGDYQVIVRDLHRRGGPEYGYLLSVVEPTPDFVLTLPADVIVAVPDQETKIVVTIDRKNGFAGEIELRAEGLPEGVEATTVVSRSDDDSAKSATLEIRSKAGAPSGPFRILGRVVPAVEGGDEHQRAATAKIAGFEVETDRPWLTIPAAPAS